MDCVLKVLETSLDKTHYGKMIIACQGDCLGISSHGYDKGGPETEVNWFVSVL
jgi:hypothetical protein